MKLRATDAEKAKPVKKGPPIKLNPLNGKYGPEGIDHGFVTLRIDRAMGVANLTVKGPSSPQPESGDGFRKLADLEVASAVTVFILAGPHQLTDILIGDSSIDDADDITYQVREGWPEYRPDPSLRTEPTSGGTRSIRLVIRRVRSDFRANRADFPRICLVLDV